MAYKFTVEVEKTADNKFKFTVTAPVTYVVGDLKPKLSEEEKWVAKALLALRSIKL